MKTTRLSASPLIVSNLSCEYLTSPLGIETARPRLGWMLQSQRRGEKQTAYQVLVASSEETLARNTGDLWDSGKVRGDQSIQVEYAGKRLRSRQQGFWKVRVWDANGKASAYSAPASFEMGLLKSSDWQGQWIAMPGRNVADQPAPIFRKVFNLAKAIRRARAYISGLGYFELYINGKRIGDHVLDPAYTAYDQRALYVTHGVGADLRPGANAVGVMLGRGWYDFRTKSVWNFDLAPWRDRPKLILQLEVEYDDGAKERIVTDTAWQVATGPVTFDALQNGETYDARQEKPLWNTADYSPPADQWQAAMVIPGPGGPLHAQQMTPIKVTGTITPVSVKEIRPGVFVYDMGQNFSGWAQLTVAGPAGTTVTLKYAEKLLPDGDIDTSNIDSLIQSGEFQTDSYILKGEGLETWEPRFTYHGFQYVRVTGLPQAATLDNLRGRVVHTAFERRGEFECSSELLNKIHHAANWSTLSNYHSIPTDCPHREKLGWMGDAQLSAEQFLYNFNPMSAYSKWMDDVADAQRPSGQLPGIVPTDGWGYNWGSGPAWDSAYINIPWYLYRYCGDTRILARHYEGMKRYVDFLGTLATDHIVQFGLGDWCPPTGRPNSHKCPTEVTSTAYHYADAVIVSRAARLLGNAADAEEYAALAQRIKGAFLARYYDPSDGTLTGKTQTSMACALFQDLLPAAERPKVLAALVAEVERCGGHIDAGILGAKYVLHALADEGRADVAYTIASKDDFPSWGNWIRQGATTLWENWDGQHTHCHHMFSDIDAWFYRALGGINLAADQPAFKVVEIRPNPVGDLTWARASHRSMYGTIRSSWRKETGRFFLDVTIPANSTGRIHLPTLDTKSVTEAGRPVARAKGVKRCPPQGGRLVLQVESGEYHFECRVD